MLGAGFLLGGKYRRLAPADRAPTAPVFALVLSSAILRERPGRFALAGVLVSAGGVALLTIG